MVGLDEALEEWLKTVQNIGELTLAEQSKITQAGAEAFKDELAKATKAKHYSDHKDPTYGHMADGLTVQGTGVDGKKNGKSTVGWENRYHAQNARRLNDGTKLYQADHFVTNVQNSSEVREKVLLAEKEEYQKIMQKKGAK
ncbi:tail assembly protein [Streptococcus phage Javan237]|uniref:Bacteriophage HK97-gp10, putative tail-component n=1 Tax=Streptococcus gallolyticus TaxID=315405 RepID=A0A1H9VI52_9STRE|nr:HK97 gp10 family phage protein [Streptococcus gallolyticus]QBX16215.1 tail assembly protein [Streptococcus phage Javan237]QBX25089.1 tail assembly protein [Streptococcus phage Javan238]SDJ74339.1 Bacteriophage HK97-gp10, putative tail-component [Streptococcus gallolyticus]SDL24723.1 Bacteriophage HK97-gp10, putative tail-component [Streptococcus gallolyticus]SES21385.1 Bacteriophage HK97-gp10, putative tail-component [Streptococcus gallolyticus]